MHHVAFLLGMLPIQQRTYPAKLVGEHLPPFFMIASTRSVPDSYVAMMFLPLFCVRCGVPRRGFYGFHGLPSGFTEFANGEVLAQSHCHVEVRVAAAGLWLCRVPCVVLMRGTSYLLFAAAVVVPVYCLVFWLLTGSYHPSTIAAFLLVEWLCVGVGVYMLRSVRSLDDYAK